MRYRLIALFSAVLSVLAVSGAAVNAEESKSDVKGLFLLTDYPAVTLRPGSTSTINLKLQNYGLPPERLALSVGGVPSGWTANLIGGGQPIAAALPPTNASVSMELRLDVQTTLARIAETAAESEVRHEVAALNERIRWTSFGVTWGPSVDVVPLDVEAVVAEWSARKVTADSPD